MTGFTVREIWRFPVKSMAGERIDEARVGRLGIYGDRGWAVRDDARGVIRSARYIPRLLLCSARYLPGTDAGLVPHVAITLPDGDVVHSDDPRVNQRLSDAIGRKLTLLSLRPETETEHLKQSDHWMVTDNMESELRMLFGLEDDEPLPDMSMIPPEKMAELTQFAAPRGTYFDSYPISIMPLATIRHLRNRLPGAELDHRRFRANFFVDDGSGSDARLEPDWLGKRARVGAACFDVGIEIARCTIIAAAHAGGFGKNTQITRTVVRDMRQMMGVYCEIGKPGVVRVGDPVAFDGG